MDERKNRGESKHAQTPASRQLNGKDQIFQLISPQKLKKHTKTKGKKPENSKSNSLGFTASPLTAYGHKSSTPKNISSKAPHHRRFFSLSQRPTSSSALKSLKNPRSSSDSKTPNKFRKFSLDSCSYFPVVSKYFYISNTGYIPGNTSKTNQDSYFAHINFANQQDSYLFGVFDGHGFYGGEVSSFIKQKLPQLLAANPDIHSDPSRALKTSIMKTNEELLKSNIDVKFSGSTLNVVLIQGRTLYCANVGDSRSMLARQLVDKKDIGNCKTGKKWMAIALSRDHKPDHLDENKRIIAKGGRVQAYQDENGNPAGPARVWLKNQDLPGLAMSRSLGDTVAASVGVTCEAEVASLNLTPDDKFIVLGSDGVFEFISNEEIVKISIPSLHISDCEGVCEAIVKEATRRWKNEEDVIDDITALCVFLDIPLNRL